MVNNMQEFCCCHYFNLFKRLLHFMPLAEWWFLKSKVLWLQYWAQWGSWKMPDGTKLFWFLIHKEPNCQSCWASSSSHWNQWPQANPARSAWFSSQDWQCCRTCTHHSWALRTQKEMIVSIKSGHAKKPWGKARDWCPTVPSFFFWSFFFAFFIQVLSVFSVNHSSTLLALFWFRSSWQETDLEI